MPDSVSACSFAEVTETPRAYSFPAYSSVLELETVRLSASATTSALNARGVAHLPM
jgi:hypothetical protein